MILWMQTEPPTMVTWLHDVVRLFYRGWRIETERTGEPEARIDAVRRDASGSVQVEFVVQDRNGTAKETVILDTGGEPAGRELEGSIRRQIRLFLYRLLARHTGREGNPYGILTGVRPTKLVHRWLDEGVLVETVTERLKNEYGIRPDKAQLLTEIAVRERPYLEKKETAACRFSLYIGIPFCPSRCSYCSFLGAVVSDYPRQVGPFMEALGKEIEILGELTKSLGIKAQSVYVGGGTPTVLTCSDLERLLGWINCYFVTAQTREITVEAGRPDTLNVEKLRLLREAGVTRICVNPQTINQSTLVSIGRNHSVHEVLEAFELARQEGLRQVNMDLIVGLPGEGLKEYANTARVIQQLRPENVTVHVLAVKRGSAIAEVYEKASFEDKMEQVERGIEMFRDYLVKAGYEPYYLYRQRYMAADMENIGYSLPGHYCLYNIQMIEERQTVLGLGAGAASKFVNPADWSLTSLYNPKNPISYVESLPRLIRTKVDKLGGLT